MCKTSECKALWAEPEGVPSFAIGAYMHPFGGIQNCTRTGRQNSD